LRASALVNQSREERAIGGVRPTTVISANLKADMFGADFPNGKQLGVSIRKAKKAKPKWSDILGVLFL
jgi:hypothetical protein